MFASIFLIVSGFVLLILGADFLVKGSVAIANKLKIPPLIVGLTIVALGTSAPELVVSLTSAVQGAAGLVLGNVIGSNIANIFLILGASAVICPIFVRKDSFYKDFLFLLLVSAVFIVFAFFEKLVFWMGCVMLAMLVAFIVFNYINAKKHVEREILAAASPWNDKPWLLVVLGTLGGLTAIVFGADWLVDGSILIARYFGVSEELIGLTIIAVGTSLPELATSCVAAYRKQSDLALGNVLGSNIWNIVFILGMTSTVTDVYVPRQFLYFDLWVMFAALFFMWLPIWRNSQIGRVAGSFFLVFYLLYIGAQIAVVKGYLVF